MPDAAPRDRRRRPPNRVGGAWPPRKPETPAANRDAGTCAGGTRVRAAFAAALAPPCPSSTCCRVSRRWRPTPYLPAEVGTAVIFQPEARRRAATPEPAPVPAARQFRDPSRRRTVNPNLVLAARCRPDRRVATYPRTAARLPAPSDSDVFEEPWPSAVQLGPAAFDATETYAEMANIVSAATRSGCPPRPRAAHRSRAGHDRAIAEPVAADAVRSAGAIRSPAPPEPRFVEEQRPRHRSSRQPKRQSRLTQQPSCSRPSRTRKPSGRVPAGAGAAARAGLPVPIFGVPVDAPAPARSRQSQAKPDPAAPTPAASADPLGPLKAMSDEEKIALFELTLPSDHVAHVDRHAGLVSAIHVLLAERKT